jgi:hypothetical protein
MLRRQDAVAFGLFTAGFRLTAVEVLPPKQTTSAAAAMAAIGMVFGVVSG